MKTLMMNAVLACTLFAPYSAAQGRGGFSGGGGGGNGFRLGGMPGGRPVTGFRHERGGFGSPASSQWGWGSSASFGDVGPWGAFGDGYQYQAPPVVVVMPQPEPPPPLPPPPPPEPARPVTHEYNWPAPASSDAEAFTLVSRDGTVRFAISVWLQDGMLNYIAQDRTVGRTRLDAIDREATARLNGEKKLILTLPPG